MDAWEPTPGPVCCVGSCCGPGSYCCGHPDNDDEHDEEDFGPAEPDILDLPETDLPGMWEFADFIGGKDAVWSEQHQRWI